MRIHICQSRRGWKDFRAGPLNFELFRLRGRTANNNGVMIHVVYLNGFRVVVPVPKKTSYHLPTAIN
jgi:hypothetical protein